MELDSALLAAHAAQDRGALVDLYAQAADQCDGDAAAFYLTQAYIFALDAGRDDATRLHARLVSLGRDR